MFNVSFFNNMLKKIISIKRLISRQFDTYFGISTKQKP